MEAWNTLQSFLSPLWLWSVSKLLWIYIQNLSRIPPLLTSPTVRANIIFCLCCYNHILPDLSVSYFPLWLLTLEPAEESSKSSRIRTCLLKTLPCPSLPPHSGEAPPCSPRLHSGEAPPRPTTASLKRRHHRVPPRLTPPSFVCLVLATLIPALPQTCKHTLLTLGLLHLSPPSRTFLPQTVIWFTPSGHPDLCSHGSSSEKPFPITLY